ncbi:MAG TPA: methionine--tRNA ligase [Thermoanaerobaculia bacterium]|nr:methionine--tRNA ligase [Thermoanaerobaculia bacterium]
MSRYFTTPIYYVNDRPHIGHLYTDIVTDVLARYSRFVGHDVRFLTGTDEHGQQLEKLAKAEGVPPIAIADRHVATFRELARTFDISNDDFIRTSDKERHYPGVLELIRRIEAAGDFETARHEGWYCDRCEAFYPEKDLVDGACPVHGKKAEWQSEENVFFRLDRYEKRLLDHYEAHPGFVFPESRLNEVKAFVVSGLKPLSVSRTTISWGIPFAGHPGHVVYVWLDALTNYISALGFGREDDSLFRKFWPEGSPDTQATHVIGKDILRFHAVYWPAFLMSAGVPLPTRVVSHGWWLRDQKKMSKSGGNVVRPDELVAAFGVDALRWHLFAEMTFGQDASFSDESFLARYNADLANGLGNTLSRAVRMAADAFSGKTPSERCDDNEVLRAAERAVAQWRTAFEDLRLNDAAEAIRGLLGAIDSYIAVKEPWKLAKAEGVTSALQRIHHNTLEGLRIAGTLLAPIVPRTAAEVLARVGAATRIEELGPEDLTWGRLPLGAPLTVGPPLFPRADAKAYFQAKEPTVTDTTEKPAPPPAPEKTTQASAPAAAPEGKIGIDEFLKLDLRVGEVLAAEKVEKSKKLMKMSIRVGDEVRTVVGGIATAYAPEQLVGRKLVIVANLAPAKLMGIESNGMVLAATLPGSGEPSLLAVDAEVPSGAKVK